jgi:hypothetical protein
MRALLITLLALSAASSSPGKVEWTADIEQGLNRAEAEGRVILLALGVASEARSEAHLKEIYGDKKLSSYFDESVNIPAWSFEVDEERDLPRFDGLKPSDHLNNLAVIMERWLQPNAEGVIALPQHVWLSPKGEVLLSCTYEIEMEEFAWCFDEAMRRAGIEERPALVKGAHPPRRLLLGEVYRLIDGDQLGRGMKQEELDTLLEEVKKRNLTGEDRNDVVQIIFTDEEDGVEYMTREFGFWELAGPRIAPVIDGTFEYIGGSASPKYLECLVKFITHNRASLRMRVAVAYEQIGHTDGLSAVKKGLKKEKDDDVRAEWVRALGACGRGDKSTSKTLVRLAEKEKDDRVRKNAILALGHLLPDEGALEALMAIAEEGEGDDRWAAVLGLALGRATEARELIEGMKEGEDDEDILKIIERSLLVLDGGNLYEIQSSFRLISESEIERWRLFFRPVPKGFGAEDKE